MYASIIYEHILRNTVSKNTDFLYVAHFQLKTELQNFSNRLWRNDCRYYINEVQYYCQMSQMLNIYPFMSNI